MSDDANPTSPVLDELRKNVLITSRPNPWGHCFTRCLGNKDKNIPCEGHRAKHRVPTARTLVKHFSSLPECGRDASFYNDVSDFLRIAYCHHHIELVKERLISWRIARGDLEEETRSGEDKKDEGDVTSIPDPADDSVLTTRSSMPSLDSDLNTDASPVSPSDTQVTTPDVSFLTSQMGTIEIETSKVLDPLTTMEPPAIEDQTEPTGPPKTTLLEPNSVEESRETTPTLSSEQIFDAETRRMRTELREREQDADKVERCMGYYAKSPEKRKLLHMMLLNFSDQDAVPGSVVVTKKRFGGEEAFAVHTKAQLSGGKGFDNSEIVYQSADNFIGASRVVELVNETFARQPKEMAVDDTMKYVGLMLPEREVIQAVRIWTDFVELLPAFVDGSLGLKGTAVANMAVQDSPNEVLQWLEKLENGHSGMNKEKEEVRGPHSGANLSPRSAAGQGVGKMGSSFLDLVPNKWPWRLPSGKNADKSSPAVVEDKGGFDQSPLEASTLTQRQLTPQDQRESPKGKRARVMRKSTDLYKKATGSFSSRKRSGEAVDEKTDDGDIYLMALPVGVLLMCNVTELKEMGAWKDPEDSGSELTVMDRFFASIEKFDDPRVNVIV